MKTGIQLLILALLLGAVLYAEEHDLLQRFTTSWRGGTEQGTESSAIAAAKAREIHSEATPDPSECRIVDSRRVSTQRKRVYRWRDENGALHFSDQLPDSDSVNATLDRVISREKKFSIRIDTERASIPAFLQDRIRTSSEAIYRFLSAPLDTSQIRQADIRLHIHGDQRTFMQAYGDYQPGQINPAGFYTSATNEAFVLEQREHKQTEVVAIHETAHAIMAALYQRTPVWLNEGVAEYFEVMPDSVIHPGYKPKPEWIKTLAVSHILPLNQLFDLTHGQWKSLPPERSYASAWATVYFLMRTDRGRGVLHRLLKEIKARPCEPVSSQAVINQAYPGGVRQLEADVNGWIRKAA